MFTLSIIPNLKGTKSELSKCLIFTLFLDLSTFAACLLTF